MEPDVPHVPDRLPTPWRKRASGLVMCGFLLVAGFYLLTEHTAHLLGVLPFLLILACPLMHVFHHHGRAKNPSMARGQGGPDMPQTGGA